MRHIVDKLQSPINLLTGGGASSVPGLLAWICTRAWDAVLHTPSGSGGIRATRQQLVMLGELLYGLDFPLDLTIQVCTTFYRYSNIGLSSFIPTFEFCIFVIPNFCITNFFCVFYVFVLHFVLNKGRQKNHLLFSIKVLLK